MFKQFSGRYGPTAIAVSNSSNIYVARFEFSCKLNDVPLFDNLLALVNDGVVTILNAQGQQLTEISVPYVPEITGLVFSRYKKPFSAVD